MQKKHYHKTIVLSTSVLITLGIVFLLAYKKRNSLPANASAVTISETTPTTSETISRENKSDEPQGTREFEQHMALTSDNIIWFTNYYRTRHGLKPLQLSQKLRNSAYYKSMDMFNHHYFGHYRPGNNLGFDNFVDNQKYSFIKIAENLAQGDLTTSKEIVDRWMQSPEHRTNILDATYSEIGVSVDRGNFAGESIVFITQHLGKPTASCPTVDIKLYTIIQQSNKTLTAIKKKIDDDTAGDEAITQLIIQYNAMIKERARMVTEYNDQVAQFDACITKG